MKIFILLFFVAVLLSCGTGATVSKMMSGDSIIVGTFYAPTGSTPKSFSIAFKDRTGKVIDTSLWTIAETYNRSDAWRSDHV